MDVLSDVLGTVHLDSGTLFRTELVAPWGIRVPPRDELAFHVVTRGRAVLQVDGIDTPRIVETGDVVMLAPRRGHTVRDAPGSPARDIMEMVADGSFRRPGDVPVVGDGPMTHLVCGWFGFSDDRSELLLAALPTVLHTRELETEDGLWLAQTVKMLSYESCAPRPGMTTVVNRLCDALFVYVLRSHLASLSAERPSWLRAIVEPRIGEALQLIHDDPGAPWSVAKLAAGVGMSRSVFSARFTRTVGEPPMRYLARWRLRKAAALLRTGGCDIRAVALQTGYGSAAAFSKAFTRATGVSPGAVRRTAHTDRRAG